MSDQNSKIPTDEKEFMDDAAYCITHCDGPCCKHYAVVVSPFDLRRIMENIPPMDINRFITFHQGVNDTQDEYPTVRIQGEEYYLGLQKEPQTHACVFETGIGICGIHTFSPLVCKLYPWAMDSNGDITYLEHVLCNHRFPTDDPESTKAYMRQFWDELEQTKKLILDWNEQYGDNPDYGGKRISPIC